MTMTTAVAPRRTTRETTGSRQVTPNARIKMALSLIVLTLFTIFALYPFLLILSTAFNNSPSLTNATIIPTEPSLSNFADLFCAPGNGNAKCPAVENPNWLSDSITASSNAPTPILRWLLNSIFVSGVSTIITLFLTTLAAFSFSRFRYRGRQASLLATLVIQVFPSVVALVAFYVLLQQIGKVVPFFGLNSLGGLIVIYCGGALGSNAWLMKGYFDTIPRDIDESAMVDGATHWVTFTQIILPLIRPILAVVALLSFIGTFNDFLIPRVLLREKEVLTLAVGLTSTLNNNFSTDWGVFASGAVLGTLPIIIIFLLLQTQIVGGLSQGAVKG